MISGPPLAVAFYSSITLHIVADCVLFLSGHVEHTINPQLHCYIHRRRESSDQKKKKPRMLGTRKEKKTNLSVTVHFTCRGS